MPTTLDLDNCASDSSSRRTLSNISLAVAKCKKIVVVTGAGISCSCGIPDFRSSDGLYNLVKQQYPDVVLRGRDLFDASLFRDPTSTAVFYTFISQLKQSVDYATPSPTHRFIKTLDTKGKLLRSYTQNIDGLEERAGLLGTSSQEAKSNGKGKAKLRVKDVRNVQLHGDIHRVRCTFCSAEFLCTEDHLKKFNAGVPPDCPECTSRSEARVARSARRLKIGTLRPAIVLYDEPHPLGDDIGTIQSSDITRKPDMLIIMGTSLKVHGFKKLVKEFAKTVRESAPPSSSPSKLPKNVKSWAGKVIFVNKTAPGSEWDGIIDYHVAGETDKWAEKVIEDWKKMRPSDWEVQKTLDASGVDGEAGAFKVVKEVASAIPAKGKSKNSKQPPERENEPPLEEDSTVSLPSPPSTSEIPQPPPSPSKRRKSGNHYSDVECSPSKKLDSRVVKERDFEGRGLLFGDTTNKTTKCLGLDNDFDLGEVPVVKPSAAKKVIGGQARTGRKMEVVIGKRRTTVRSKTRTACSA